MTYAVILINDTNWYALSHHATHDEAWDAWVKKPERVRRVTHIATVRDTPND